MDKKVFWTKTRDWLKKNQLPLLYFGFAVIIEMMAVSAVEGSPFMDRPMLMFGLLVFFVGGMLAIPDNRIRIAVGGVLLVAQTVIDLIFAALYDMTGQYFEFSLLHLRNDAVAALEKIPVNFLVFYMGLFCCIAFIVYGLRFVKVQENKKQTFKKKPFYVYLATAAAGVATMGVSFLAYYPQNSNKYEEMLTGKSTSVYASYGMIGNLFGEIGNAIRGDKSTMTDEEISKFIYAKTSQPTDFYGKLKDKNVVVILSESFEWYSFMNSAQFYDSPNLLGFTEEQLARLYPNLTRFYNESVVATNFHSREKTDASETLSILGAYPTEKYITYDYYDVAMPQTLPNMLKALDENKGDEDKAIQIRSFHNGEKKFYNREVTHKTFGFEYLTDRYDMAEQADELYQAEKKALEEAGRQEEADALIPIFTDYKEKYDEMNLDSEMIEICKDEMFPTDRRFYTYITTITMHGAYYNRRSLQSARAELETELAGKLPVTTDEKANILLHYMTTAKEFDKAIGCIYADLEAKDLLDDTVILMFGDHNAYYNELSNYVKDIDGYDTERKFTDMYNVPLMIRDTDLTQAVEDRWQTRFIDKFACTSDIMPTLMDLLGIKYYSNMYYGHSLFDYTEVTDEEGMPVRDENGLVVRLPVESVLYSRSYDVFVYDGIVGRTVITPLYRQAELTDARMKAYEEEAKRLVEKIKYCDYMFKQDFFADADNAADFAARLQSLNAK